MRALVEVDALTDLACVDSVGHVGSTLDFRNTAQYDTLGRVTEIIQQNQAGGNAVTAKRAAFEYNKLNQRTKLTR